MMSLFYEWSAFENSFVGQPYEKGEDPRFAASSQSVVCWMKPRSGASTCFFSRSPHLYAARIVTRVKKIILWIGCTADAIYKSLTRA